MACESGANAPCDGQESQKQPTKHYGKGRIFYTNKKKRSRENYIRNIVESIFRSPFPSIRPEWLINPKTGRRLELDLYNKSLRLSFECDGIQHSQYLPYFHKTYSRFQDMKDRDLMKSILCKKRGLTLIRIPHDIPDNELEGFLLSEIHKKYKN